jgi:hypothetical protein
VVKREDQKKAKKIKKNRKILKRQNLKRKKREKNDNIIYNKLYIMCTGIFLRTQENEYLFSRTLE